MKMKLVARIVFEILNCLVLIGSGAVLIADIQTHSPWSPVLVMVLLFLVAANAFRAYWVERLIVVQRELIRVLRYDGLGRDGVPLHGEKCEQSNSVGDGG